MAFIQFQFRRGLAAEWVSVNPILAEGEQGIETDTGKYKIGDGSSDWNTLTYKGLGQSGFSGYSGAGFSGFSGFSSKSGFSGPSGYSGVGGGSSSIFAYRALTGVAGVDPGAGKMTWNNATQISSTILGFDILAENGLDVTIGLTSLEVGNKLYLQDFGASANFQEWNVVSVADMTGWFAVTVTLNTSGGTGTTNFANDTLLALRVTRPGASGYSGRSGYSGFCGTGTSGYSGFSGAGLSGFSGYSSTAPGTSGFSGFCGTGTSGFSGYSGAAGGAGGTGSSGFSGYSGSGTSGYSGFSGVGTSGFSGFSGAAGSAGSAGTSGFSGFSGYSGYSGFSGSGISGYSAYSGFSGFSGYSGKSGYSAYSGYSGPQLLTFQTVTDADYPLVLADANTGIKMVSASAHSVNIPLNATQAFPTGTQIVVEQAGAGLVSITVTGGVTLQGATTTNGQYTSVVLIKQATDTWYATSSNLSGYSGYSGPSGFSGFSGKSGYSGFSGFSGISAYSGFSGAGAVYANATGEAFTSTSLANVAGLTFALVTGTYIFEAYLFGQVTSGSAGVKIGINYTGTYTSGDYQTTGLTTSATVQAAPERGTLNATATTLAYMTVATTEQWIYIRGRIVTGGSGTFTIQALKVTSQTFTIRASSWAMVAKTA